MGSATSEIKITRVSVRRTGDTAYRRQVLEAKVVLFRTASTEIKDMSGGPSDLDVLEGGQSSFSRIGGPTAS